MASLRPNSYQTDIPQGQRKLAIILPANGPSEELCKVIASAVALGYPTPIIVNWWKDGLHPSPDDSIPSHLLKIVGILDFLEWATSDQAAKHERLDEDDLVLIMDAHDVWLQLPPEVLLERYFAANARTNERLAEKFGHLHKRVPYQSILVSAQKRCVGPRNKLSDLHCDEMPESPVSNDVYGFFTDSQIFKAEYRRTRYLNSGGFIGPAGDLIRYFARTEVRMYEHLNSPSTAELSGDQGIFAEIWAEQELWRDQALSSGSMEEEDEFEYHVGLDYFQEIVYPTCGSERSGAFVEIADTQALEDASSTAGVTPLRLQSLPHDISLADSPLSLMEREMRWNEASLFVDFWTTTIPVAVHHNAYAKGLKARQQTWWDRTWYFPHLRNLLDLRMSSNETGAAVELPLEEGGFVARPYVEREGTEAALLYAQKEGQLRRATWDEVCRSDDGRVDWWEEVFRDRRGSMG